MRGGATRQAMRSDSGDTVKQQGEEAFMFLGARRHTQ